MNPLACLIVNGVIFVVLTLGCLAFDHTGTTSAVADFIWLLPAFASLMIADG